MPIPMYSCSVIVKISVSDPNLGVMEGAQVKRRLTPLPLIGSLAWPVLVRLHHPSLDLAAVEA